MAWPCLFSLGSARILLGLLFLLAEGSAAVGAEKTAQVPKWTRFERSFESPIHYTNPIQEAEVRVVFTSPQGSSTVVDAFWDGEKTWRVRFSPNEIGPWIYSTTCSDPNNSGLGGQSGSFLCTAPRGQTIFEKHGPLRLTFNGRALMHDDTTPFFWLADTAWCGPLLSTPEEWDTYLADRQHQKFTAVQWVTTQFRAAPEGNRDHELAFTGSGAIAINPAFFRSLDVKVEALDRAGMLSVPVLLWALSGGANPRVNPGVALPDDQAILLARYMVARWGAYNVVWILAGDGDYRGPQAARWKRIGHDVFEDAPNALVTLHPGGMQWYLDDFRDEPWLKLVGYQSGHGDDEETLRWLVSGPVSTGWEKRPFRPFINLEPPYENHLAYQSKKPHSPENVRRAVYWSLLNAPTAGVTYGGHGVWGWDDGTRPPTDHPDTGVPLAWEKALDMPAANQMAHVFELFTALEFWRLRPAPEVLARQPGTAAPERWIAAARSERGDALLAYTPEEPTIALRPRSLPTQFKARWFDPRSGEFSEAKSAAREGATEFNVPGPGDWMLVVEVGAVRAP